MNEISGPPKPNTEMTNVQEQSGYEISPTGQMIHEERMSRNSVLRSKYVAVKMGLVLLIILTICSFIAWNMIRPVALQDNISENVRILCERGEFNRARDEAKKLQSRSSGLFEWLKFQTESNRLQNMIKREEANWKASNYITVGRSAKSFIGMRQQEAKKELINKGFNKKKIKLIQIEREDLSKNEKNYEPGTVISVSFGGNKRFGREDRFAPDTNIEILYVGK